MLSGWCDTGGCNSLPHIEPPIWPEDLNLNSSVQRTLFHCSIVQSLCALAHWSLLTLFCFLKSGFLTAILPFRPAWLSLFLTVDVDTLFSWHRFICAATFGAVSLLSHKLVTLMKLFSILVTAFGLPALLLVFFYPIYNIYSFFHWFKGYLWLSLSWMSKLILFKINWK